MARKEDLRFVRTNRKLYETFWELCGETVMDELSVTDICEAADINRATFYKHFEDRKEFSMYCIARKLLETRLEHTGREFVSVETYYEDVLHEMYAFLRYVKNLNVDHLLAGSSSVRTLYDGMMRFYFDEFSNVIKKAKIAPQVDAGVYAAYRIGSLLSIGFYSFMKGDTLMSEEACESVISSLIPRLKEAERMLSDKP